MNKHVLKQLTKLYMEVVITNGIYLIVKSLKIFHLII